MILTFYENWKRLLNWRKRLCTFINTLETWCITERLNNTYEKENTEMAAKLNWRYCRDAERLFPSGVLRMKRLSFFEMHWCSNGWLLNAIAKKKICLNILIPGSDDTISRDAKLGQVLLYGIHSVPKLIFIVCMILIWTKNKIVIYYFIYIKIIYNDCT